MKVRALYLFIFIFILFSCSKKQDSNEESSSEKKNNLPAKIQKIKNANPRNVIFILSDDHRYDYMGFLDKVPWLKTPNMDEMYKKGAYFERAFVSTSLCSPSRASILTGEYAHEHKVVDNQAPNPGNLTYFPQYLQKAGYQTSFFGKWHMGDHTAEPRPGFDHWESFKGQGHYFSPTLNINGEKVKYSDTTYTTDLLTDHAIEWLKNRNKDKPFFMYLSHKGVHASFQPAPRHKGMYEDKPVFYPETYFPPPEVIKNDTSIDVPSRFSMKEIAKMTNDYNYDKLPDWVKRQRYSWHGVDYMYHGRTNYKEFFRDYCETLMSVDESIGRVNDYLEKNNMADSTIVIYMGDNGFSFGEHGLIDKRHMYSESFKVPMLIKWPEKIEGGTRIQPMVQNLDIGPTVMELAGLKTPDYMSGRSFVPVLNGNTENWRDKVFYEYYWEYDFPMTPTVFGVRTDRYKLIRYHGIWDWNEFYDLKNDPMEKRNLMGNSKYEDKIKNMTKDLYDWLEKTGGMQIPLKRTIDNPAGDYKHPDQY